MNEDDVNPESGSSAYACSACGYHPRNEAAWCAGGCGRDYNRMTRIVLDDFWSEILGAERVQPQTILELNDYAMLLREVPKVYDHITGGAISKPNTLADAVIAEADARAEWLVMENLRDRDCLDCANYQALMDERTDERSPT